MISIEEFQKADLRIGIVRQAEAVEGSEKLLCLRVLVGEEERQILAGIARSYRPEDLVGRLVVVIVNLEPRALMGRESQGMLLAADTPDGPSLLRPDREAPAGSRIR